MDFKYKIFVWVGTLAVLFIFRYEIAAHFNLDHLLGPQVEKVVATKIKTQKNAEGEQGVFPEVVTINKGNAPLYRTPGSGIIAKGNVGHEVTVLDVEDTNQQYINVRYNGISGYMNRNDLTFEANEEGEN